MGIADVIPPRVPHGYAEIIAYFGDPKPTRGPDGEWTVDQAWERANMVSFAHPMIPTGSCRRCGAQQHGRLFVHRLFVDPMKRTLDGWAQLQRDGSNYAIDHLACFAPRAQRGSNGLLPSVHTWGAAFDLNPEDNQLIVGIDVDDQRRRTDRTIPDSWVAVAKADGLTWGGDFVHRFDPMHFQAASGY